MNRNWEWRAVTWAEMRVLGELLRRRVDLTKAEQEALLAVIALGGRSRRGPVFCPSCKSHQPRALFKQGDFVGKRCAPCEKLHQEKLEQRRLERARIVLLGKGLLEREALS